MCLLLGDFLRETLALGGERHITVARELKLAERFLAVERIRFGDRLDVEISADESAAAEQLPPLLLQPIVENAVTHGIAHMLERGTIRIAATRTPDRLAIVVENPCDPDRPARHGHRRRPGERPGAAEGACTVRRQAVTTTERDGRWQVELSFPAAPRLRRGGGCSQRRHRRQTQPQRNRSAGGCRHGARMTTAIPFA